MNAVEITVKSWDHCCQQFTVFIDFNSNLVYFITTATCNVEYSMYAVEITVKSWNHYYQQFTVILQGKVLQCSERRIPSNPPHPLCPPHTLGHVEMALFGTVTME